MKNSNIVFASESEAIQRLISKSLRSLDCEAWLAKTKMWLAKTAAMLGITCWLISCSPSPPMEEEDINYPTSTRSGVQYVEDKGNEDKTDLSRIAWWRALQDPELDALIMEALQCNNKIKSAYATIEQAEAQLQSTQAAWLPTLNAAANGFNANTWNTHRTLESLPLTNPFFNLRHPKFSGYYAGFVPQYNLNILNNIYNVRASKANLAMQEAQSQATKLSIISQMSGAYFMLLSQRAQLLAEKGLMRDLKKLKQLEQVRFRKGASNIALITNLDQQIAEEDAKIPSIENVIAQSENTIHLLLNQNPASLPTACSFGALPVNHLIPNNLPASVLHNRPDIMIATNQLNAACAQIGIAYSAFFPTISLTGLLGKASLQLRDLLKISTNLWVVDASLVAKILDASSYHNIKASKAAFKATYYNYIETLRSAFADVDNNLSNASNHKLVYLQAQKGYQAAQKAYRIAQNQYKAGSTDYRNVANAKINMDRSLLNLIQVKAQFLDSVVQVYGAVGGGYDVDCKLS